MVVYLVISMLKVAKIGQSYKGWFNNICEWLLILDIWVVIQEMMGDVVGNDL